MGTGMPRTPRIRSAYPLKTTAFSGSVAREGGTRSGYTYRIPSLNYLKNTDYGKMLEDISQLSIKNSRHDVQGGTQAARDTHQVKNSRYSVQETAIPAVSNARSYTALKRLKLQAPSILYKPPHVQESVLPPLPKTAVQSKSKCKTLSSMASVVAADHKSAGIGHSGIGGGHYPAKRLSSAVSRITPPVKVSHLHRHLGNPPSFHNSKHEIQVSVIGTSFDPVVRPIRLRFRANP